MEIKAKVALSLPNKFYKITLRYDTYQKASYDAYLVANLLLNEPIEAKAYQYIDEVCGKGSLNQHFKNLYQEISKLTKEQIRGIVDNSLYPVTMIVKDHCKYYEDFEATRFKDKVFSGDLTKQEEIVKQILMPKENGTTFLDIRFEEGDAVIKKDMYDAIFSEDQILINLDNNQFLPISRGAFERVYEGQNLDINIYPGKVTSNISAGQWNVLTQTILEAYQKERFQYVDGEGNYTAIFNEYIKSVSVINVFGLYFYKETKYDFVKGNKARCEEAIKYMLDYGWINEYKVRSLVRLISIVSDDLVKKVVEYILHRKDSKELSEVGLGLIKSGFEKGWNKEALSTMKKYATAESINYLYKVDDSLGYTDEELLNVDKNNLNEADQIRVKAYISKIDNLKSEINRMIGEITTSGVREKMKSLKTKDSIYKNLSNFIKERMAHFRGTYEDMSLEELTKNYNEVKTIYDGAFATIMKRLTKDEDKA